MRRRIAESRIPWAPEELRVLEALDSPQRIQAFLDATPYSADPIYRSPRSVLRDRRAHCFDGAMLVCAAMRHHGEPTLLVNLRAIRDDDHVLALFRAHGRFGSIAKSNTTGLRYREPIFRTLRELALSFFEDYYNTAAEKTLRAWSRPVDLARFDRQEWWFRDAAMDAIADALDSAKHTEIAPDRVVRGYAKVDERAFEAGFLGANPDGLYKAK